MKTALKPLTYVSKPRERFLRRGNRRGFKPRPRAAEPLRSSCVASLKVRTLGGNILKQFVPLIDL